MLLRPLERVGPGFRCGERSAKDLSPRTSREDYQRFPQAGLKKDLLVLLDLQKYRNSGISFSQHFFLAKRAEPQRGVVWNQQLRLDSRSQAHIVAKALGRLWESLFQYEVDECDLGSGDPLILSRKERKGAEYVC